MNAGIERKPSWLVFNPFVYVAGAKALLLGVGAILLAGLLGWASHTHFDGVLDTHIGAHGPWWLFLSEGLIDWLCLAAVLWGFGRMVSRTAFRAIDVFGTQALARWPTIFLSLVTLPPGFLRFTNSLVEQMTRPATNPASNLQNLQWNVPDAIVFLAVALAMLLLICWMVALMYKAYSIACNLKGGKAVGTFIAGLILAEILSKLAILTIWKWS